MSKKQIIYFIAIFLPLWTIFVYVIGILAANL